MSSKKNNLSENKRFDFLKVVKSPNVSENLLILLSLFLLSTMLGMLFILYILQNSLTNSYNIQKKQQERFSFWMEKIEEYPNSPDILYNAAVSAYDVKKYETALKLVKKAMILDPQFKEAENFEKDILKNYQK